MTSSLQIVCLNVKDNQADELERILENVARLEQQLFADAWDKTAILSTLSQFGAGVLIAHIDGAMVGYCIYQVVFEVAEVLRIATNPSFQKQGVGGALLSQFTALCQQQEVQRILLEVRADNVSAMNLYHKHKFYQIDVRANYYQVNGCAIDALILQKDL